MCECVLERKSHRIFIQMANTQRHGWDEGASGRSQSNRRVACIIIIIIIVVHIRMCELRMRLKNKNKLSVELTGCEYAVNNTTVATHLHTHICTWNECYCFFYIHSLSLFAFVSFFARFVLASFMHPSPANFLQLPLPLPYFFFFTFRFCFDNERLLCMHLYIYDNKNNNIGERRVEAAIGNRVWRREQRKKENAEQKKELF